YGKLYNYYAVIDSRGLAPLGWHIPRAAEWDELSSALGGEEVAGAKLKSKTGWNMVSGTDETGFTALPAGYCTEKGNANYRGQITSFWSDDEGVDVIFGLLYHLSKDDGKLVKVNLLKEAGASVRCVKN
ncbi:MAG: fibrobacter succinogenes major paralogous domain-containing protein, partial [Ferruginibacter sp.]